MALRLAGCRRLSDRAAASAGVTRRSPSAAEAHRERLEPGRASEGRGRTVRVGDHRSTTPEGMIVMYAICRPVGATVALSGRSPQGV